MRWGRIALLLTSDDGSRIPSLVLSGLGIPLFVLAWVAFGLSHGSALMVVIVVFVVVAIVKRDVVRKPSILIPLCLLFIIESGVALLARIPDDLPGYAMVPVCVANGVFILAIVETIEKLIARRGGRPEGA